MPQKTIPHSRLTLDRAEQKAVAAVVASGRLAQGPRVAEFERKIARSTGKKYGVAVTSGTVALEMALRALRIGPGDGVIMPSFVCTALMLAVQKVGAFPVLADIDPDSLNISTTAVDAVFTKKVKCIIIPHLFGLPVEIPRFRKYGVPVIEDCAQGFGFPGAGKTGVISVFSFYATKLITTGEGGMACTDSPALRDAMAGLRSYDEKTETGDFYNYKLTDLQAALGLCQLKRLPDFIKCRRKIARFYRENISNPAVILPTDAPGHIWFRFVVRVRGSLDRVQRRLEQAGIAARRPVFRPLHHYLGGTRYPHTEMAFQTCLSIPIYPSLTLRKCRYIADSVNKL
jgi:dTDP-4-amino-4,6-dideoxygalactose transaminase